MVCRSRLQPQKKGRTRGTSHSPVRTGGTADGGGSVTSSTMEFATSPLKMDPDLLERKRLTLPFLDKLEYVRLQLSMRGVGEQLPPSLAATFARSSPSPSQPPTSQMPAQVPGSRPLSSSQAFDSRASSAAAAAGGNPATRDTFFTPVRGPMPPRIRRDSAGSVDSDLGVMGPMPGTPLQFETVSEWEGSAPGLGGLAATPIVPAGTTAMWPGKS